MSFIYASRPQEAKAYAQELIGTAGEPGGILDFGAGLDDGREQHLGAMIDAVKRYANYR